MEGAACWVLVESPQGKILRESLEALSVGLSFQKQYKMQAVVLWTGVSPEEAQAAYLSSLGVKKMICLEGSPEGPAREEALLFGLKELYTKRSPQYFFFGASHLSLSLAPKLAALLERGYVAKATYLRKIGDALALTRPLLQGKLSEILHFLPPTCGLASLYPRSFDVPKPLPGPQEDKLVTEIYPLRHSEEEMRTLEIVESEIEPAGSLELEDAEIVVSGGKGMGSKQGFELLQELAILLGGTVGSSRIAMDLGWAPKERLVGQTGKKICPELYIACGISGAQHHRAGMKDSRYILAINTDPQAPIFQVATWGIVADAPQVVSEMIQHVKEEKNRT